MTSYYRVYPIDNGTTDIISAQWVEAKAVRKFKKDTRKHLRKYLGVKGKITFSAQETATSEDFAGTCVLFTRKGLKVQKM